MSHSDDSNIITPFTAELVESSELIFTDWEDLVFEGFVWSLKSFSLWFIQGQ
jgi:hypothetical protein